MSDDARFANESLQYIIELKAVEVERAAAEIASLKLLAEMYPEAKFVRDRLYEVEEFRPDDRPTKIYQENGLVYPCVFLGSDFSGVYLRRAARVGFGGPKGVSPEHVVTRIFARDPEAVLTALL